jgi:hypothetical protein
VPPAVSGDGVASGVFELTFYVDSPTLDLTPAPPPAGGYSAAFRSGLFPPGDTDAFTVRAKAGQEIYGHATLGAQRNFVITTIELRDPDGGVLARVEAPELAADVELHPVVAPVDGVYTFTVGFEDGANGRFQGVVSVRG